MKTAEIRQRFLEFFQQNQHTLVSSSPLVPANDPTLLFTNAGMVQFKDLFLGNQKADYVRATTSQRCVRAGGKHNDLENVGYTARHHTFFEMLGNFSFGDYFKREAIQYAWQFLTKELGLPEDKLWITVFEKDDEAADIWLNEVGVSKERFSRIGEKDNFWSMGDVGPCGPCSEIFYDHGPEVAGGPPGTPEEDGDRYIEIWNLVFMQFNRGSDGELTPLPKPSVDTGMGLERVAAVMQNKHNNYDIDLFAHLTKAICQVLNIADQRHHSVRVIADHIRSCSFLICDGVLPSNEGRGYVLRRIIRRAIRHGSQLGAKEAFFYKLVMPLVSEMGQAYPELAQSQQTIEQALQKEELRFAETLEQGLKIFEQKTQDLETNVVSGELVFLLYDTYGFPADLTADVARERGLSIDEAGFEVCMNSQRERARASSQFSSQQTEVIDVDAETEFAGYQRCQDTANVLVLHKLTEQGSEKVPLIQANEKALMVLDRSVFYAQGGGQVADQGWVSCDGFKGRVIDCQKQANGAFVHTIEVEQGELRVGSKVNLMVDEVFRNATAANHSATHLLHAALKQILGAHVNQKGSLVNPQRLRFDFSHDEPVSDEQIAEIEALVNQQILSKKQVSVQVMELAQAKAAGAEALFGEKYSEQVRVVSMGEFSLELCGGTHVDNCAEIGLFKITHESGVAAGVRRIEAVTSSGALAWVNQQQALLNEVANSLNVQPPQIVKRVQQLQSSLRTLEQDKKKLQQLIASGSGTAEQQDEMLEVGDVVLLAKQMDGVDKDMLRATIDQFKDKYANGIIVLGAEIDGKARLVAGVSKSISKQFPAGKLIQHITALADGRGGGRPDMAEGGVADSQQLSTCLGAVKSWVESQL